jgi:cysteine synthase
MVKESGEFTPGEAIVGPISNNMGITLAMTGVVKGHQVQ